MRSLVPWVLFLAACGSDPVEVTWVESAGFSWSAVNHRLSYLSLLLDEDLARLAVVGGASSTGWFAPLPDGCDEATCDEYPFYDSTTVTLGWARTLLDDAGAGTLEQVIIADADGESTTLTIPIEPAVPRATDALVVLQGFALDTNWPLAGGESCYQPSNGWLPRRISVVLTDARLSSDGDAVEVECNVAFEAGYSLEEARVCLDDVVEQAKVPFNLRLLAVAGDVQPSTTDISYDMAWALEDEQSDADLSARPYCAPSATVLAGWLAFDFRFHQQDTDLRGAYLRSLHLDLDPVQGWASGHATNVSPITQLSGFDYTFTGQVTAMPVNGEVERQTLTVGLDAALDDDHHPVVSEVALEGE